MSALLLLAVLLMFSAICFVLVHLEEKREQVFLDFLANPDEYHEERLLGVLVPAQGEAVRLLGRCLRDKQNAYIGLLEQMNDYEEYVEAWAHEAKTPLSLLALLLDNRREELSENVSCKLDYIQNRLQESVDQMLFYARLKGSRKDYLFEHISVRGCVEEVLEDYKPLLEEKQFQIQADMTEQTVCSDRRGLHFLLCQIISNSVKYSSQDPELVIRSFQKEDRRILSIRDNGTGVRGCDLPYIFEKGFTGHSGDSRKNATGMGLYLAKETAKELNIELEAYAQQGEGLEMQLSFPMIDLTQRRT